MIKLKKFSLTIATFLFAVGMISPLSSNNSVVSADIIANPVISRNCPAYSNHDQEIKYANDDAYFSFWNSEVSTYLAYDLSAVPENERKEVLAVWYNTTGAFDYTVLDYSSSISMPTDYTIEVNSAPGGTYPETGWKTIETVENNTCHSRQHAVNMKGYNWIRINITGADGKDSGRVSINFDIHNTSEGISDSWIFYGDSITACGMHNCYGTGFATYVNRLDSRYFPAQENGGIGGIMSTHGAKNIERWLSVFPGKYVSVAYGTNDCWGNQTGAEKYYENTAFMVEKIIESGKVPIVPTIPYSTEPGITPHLDSYNEMVHKIYETYPEVVKGPDFATIFKENPEYLSADGVHPNDTGYDRMRQIWAETMYETIYKSESTTPPPADNQTLPGDINGDSVVNALDLHKLITYFLGTEQNIEVSNADIDKNNRIDIADLINLKAMLLI